MKLEQVIKHFVTITKHKLTVMDLCFKVGMVEQAFLHDLSKILSYLGLQQGC